VFLNEDDGGGWASNLTGVLKHEEFATLLAKSSAQTARCARNSTTTQISPSSADRPEWVPHELASPEDSAILIYLSRISANHSEETLVTSVHDLYS
jgi:hypothetical protein